MKTHLVISGNHYEVGEFFVFDSPTTQVILGFPWLKKYNPIIKWVDGQIEKQSTFCLSKCLCATATSCQKKSTSLDDVDLSKVPAIYHNLAPAFS